MDPQKVGALIRRLRTESRRTQKQLADALHVSDRAVSKWERGLGCPDVSLLGALSRELGVNIERILSGDPPSRQTNGGTMKRVKFYVCPACGNVVLDTGAAEISCCGRRLEPLKPQPADACHQVCLQEVENEFYAVMEHPMDKQHFVAFAAWVSYDSAHLVRLYPEQEAAFRLPHLRRGTLYVYCSRHGLFAQKY